jgi:hypothetical protein
VFLNFGAGDCYRGFFVCVIRGFEIRASQPLEQSSLIYFRDGISSFYPRLSSDWDPPPSAQLVLQAHTTISPVCFVRQHLDDFLNFLPRLASTHDSIFTSQVAGIVSMHYHSQILFILRWGLAKLPRLALHLQSSHINLQNGWDYRPVQPCLALFKPVGFSWCQPLSGE